ncbi:MAG: helix-turn-helix transcriptional regulator [Methylacidiphilales bacterium]|nr:helix-turn-helix transcriptional regulator [Candidatus Methylacidiphilales bacterium]
MENQTIDKKWFLGQLKDKGKSVRGLARHMDIDASAASRMLSGKRKMKMDEVSKIAIFLGVQVSEVLKHAGVAVDIDGNPTGILLAAIIDESGRVTKMPDPKPLPQNLIDRAKDATRGIEAEIIAAQVMATAGPLAVWDDAVVLFEVSDIVEPSAIGALSICRLRSGEQVLARVERARKTGEATLRRTGREPEEVTLVTATPVLAIIP